MDVNYATHVHVAYVTCGKGVLIWIRDAEFVISIVPSPGGQKTVIALTFCLLYADCMWVLSIHRAIFLSSFMTYHQVCNWCNMTGAISGAGTAYPSWEPESPRYGGAVNGCFDCYIYNTKKRGDIWLKKKILPCKQPLLTKRMGIPFAVMCQTTTPNKEDGNTLCCHVSNNYS